MKLTEIKSERGVYVGLRVLSPGTKLIRDYIEENDIPHKTSTKEERKHVTVIFSKKYAEIDPISTKKYVAVPIGFEVWPTQDGKRALVLKLDAPGVVARHNDLMSEHDLTYDYPKFSVHVTFTYDAGELRAEDLPAFPHHIILGDEYVEDLKLGWQNS